MIYRQFSTPFDVMSEAQRKALEYWQSLKPADGEDAPSQKAFKLIDLPPPILPTTHLADVSEGGDEFRFRYWGSGMTEFLGYDATGGTTRDLIPRVMGDRLHEVFRSIVRTRRAMAMVSEFERPNSGVVGFQKFVRMPLLADAVVVATQGKRDREALKAALGTPAGYVSMVGSRRKIAALRDALAAEETIPVERLGQLKGPAGFDVGAVGPEEIALSIVVEIVAFMRGSDTQTTTNSRGATP